VIRVLVVDDSALVRELLTALLSGDPELTVVGTAVDPYDARDKVLALSPDVITLDVEMPKMDGITFLRSLMKRKPTPVVMVSTLTERGADVTMAALAAGAVDFIAKPKFDLADGLERQRHMLLAKVKAAARANLKAIAHLPLPPAPAPTVRAVVAGARPSDRLIAIGASTGGTEAVAEVLRTFPPDSPGVVITQHIPEMFSARWAARLSNTTPLEVAEAVDGAPILVGHGYVAPGGRHLRVAKALSGWVCKLGDDAPVNGHRGSVEVLFDSVGEAAGPRAVAALMTGMGVDGSKALLRLRQRGCFTIAQDEASSVVWGMPGEAVRLGGAVEVEPLTRIAARLIAQVRRELRRVG
jgi:two-component system chemotaxis response regulator CheB